MFVKDVGYGAYAIHIDDPCLYNQFVQLCEEYGYKWIFGDSLTSDAPTELHKHIQTGNLMIYTPRVLARMKAANLPLYHLFTMGAYTRYCECEERHRDRQFVRLSEMEDFAKYVHAEDMSDCVTNLIADFV